MLNLNLELKPYFRIQHFSDVVIAEKDLDIFRCMGRIFALNLSQQFLLLLPTLNVYIDNSGSF